MPDIPSSASSSDADAPDHSHASPGAPASVPRKAAAAPRILAFAGSARRDSFNRKLVAVVAQGARDAGAEVTEIDLGELPMPIYDQDLEAAEGLPAEAKRFKALLREHHGLLIASPEFNSSITPLLKNCLDWASRSEEGDGKPLVAYKGKVAALVSASPGRLGGLRGLVHVRSILQNIGVMVIPDQLAVSHAHQAFSADGQLADSRVASRARAIGQQLSETLEKLLD